MARDDETTNRRSSPGRSPIRTCLATVVRSVEVTPRMLRLTFGGDGLRGFDGGRQADEHVKLFFPPKGEPIPVLPEFGPEGLVFPDGATPPHARNYTVRRFDPVGLELDVDFVIHGNGRAVEWARDARPGDVLGIAGPAPGSHPPADADQLLIAGDETALPAVASILERLAPGTRAHVFVEVADRNEEQCLAAAPDTDVRVRWLHRDTTTDAEEDQLADAVCEFPWPDGTVYAWVAGEALTVRTIRRYLRNERGMNRHTLHAAGYWRRGKTVEEWLSEPEDTDR
ncbi:siderophore-interacting protein [Embleya scabrispora]|uniref:siderophore-interacting protein n=1 Tax=Embleya scabrispora TaxID=159449 RepID=UPI00038271FE|nr:siderophore-interacting protein [Embleya scabrispora]MYS86088.1 SIP domain-containing protein [Streptomyces sp. SID5474]